MDLRNKAQQINKTSSQDKLKASHEALFAH